MSPKQQSAAELPLDAPRSVVKAGPLAVALGQAAGMLTQEDYDDGGKEAPIVHYLQVRQKDLKGERGEVVRPAGPFRIGNVADLTHEDREELNLTVLVFRPNRVYFEKL